MDFQEWDDRIDDRISEDIIAEFHEAVVNFDIDKMNELHQEWNLFFDCIDEDSEIYFAKVEEGVMILPEAVRDAINKNMRYVCILKDNKSLYLIENTADAKYMVDAVNDANGCCVDRRVMSVKNIFVFDDIMQNVFDWEDEDFTVIYVFQHGLRIDRFYYG